MMAYTSHTHWKVEGRFEKRGDKTTRHAHDHDHISGVRKGAAMVSLWHLADESVAIHARLVPGAFINVPAEWKHEIEALEDDTETYCAFDRFNADGSERQDPSSSHRLEAEGKPWR